MILVRDSFFWHFHFAALNDRFPAAGGKSQNVKCYYFEPLCSDAGLLARNINTLMLQSRRRCSQMRLVCVKESSVWAQEKVPASDGHNLNGDDQPEPFQEAFFAGLVVK